MSNEKLDLHEQVMVVATDEGTRKIVMAALEDLTLNGKGFPSADLALKEMGGLNPFLTIVDFKLIDMDPFVFEQEIRKEFPVMPIMFLVESIDKESAVSGLARNCQIIEKPVKKETLKNFILKSAKQRISDIENDNKEIEEITQLFVEESYDLMKDAHQLILRLEEEPIDPTVINSLFRKVHSIKGGASALPNAKTLNALMHAFETVLSSVKKGEIVPNAKSINLFLESADLCLHILNVIKSNAQPDDKLLSSVKAAVVGLKNLKDSGNVVSEKKVVQTEVPGTAQSFQQEEEGIWVTNEKLDSFMALSGELIVLKNNFYMMSRDVGIRSSPEKLEKKHSEFAYSLNKITDHLQEHIMSVRKVSLEKAFSKLGRIIRQTGLEVGKKIKLRTEGLELGVDKNIAASLSSSLVHMVRNSIDHGIETPQKRKEAGKQEEGTILIKAFESRGVIHMIVSDDGGGIPKNKLLDRALQSELITQAKVPSMTDEEILDLIFLPGFTTAEKVTDLSGRGVGMDVVKSSVLQHSGKIRVETEPGIGSKFYLEIPVPKAVMVEYTVLSRWKGSMFAVPLTAIARIVSCNRLTLTEIGHVRMCQYDGKSIVLRSFDELLHGRDIENAETVKFKTVIVLRHKEKFVGLLVDCIEDQFEAVVRSFDHIVKKIPGFKGTAILGNDEIAYVISPEEMVGLLQKDESVAA
ncbi:MAG: ATP-binding protein [Pseudomonadota bacterium]|nr:ATP-binding protein [Pseudomonadota bacterium]